MTRKAKPLTDIPIDEVDNYEIEKECVFEMALRLAGYNQSSEFAKTCYRLALQTHEMGDQLSVRDIAIIQAQVKRELKDGKLNI